MHNQNLVRLTADLAIETNVEIEVFSLRGPGDDGRLRAPEVRRGESPLVGKITGAFLSSNPPGKTAEERSWVEIELQGEEGNRARVIRLPAVEVAKAQARDCLVRNCADVLSVGEICGECGRKKNDEGEMVNPDEEVERFSTGLRYALQTAQEKVASFRETLVKSPGYAFEWAKDSFEAAAEIEVVSGLLDAIENRLSIGKPITMDEIGDWLRREVDRRADYPSFSTSPTSNLMEQMRLSVGSRILGRVSGRRPY